MEEILKTGVVYVLKDKSKMPWKHILSKEDVKFSHQAYYQYVPVWSHHRQRWEMLDTYKLKRRGTTVEKQVEYIKSLGSKEFNDRERSNGDYAIYEATASYYADLRYILTEDNKHLFEVLYDPAQYELCNQKTTYDYDSGDVASRVRLGYEWQYSNGGSYFIKKGAEPNKQKLLRNIVSNNLQELYWHAWCKDLDKVEDLKEFAGKDLLKDIDRMYEKLSLYNQYQAKFCNSKLTIKKRRVKNR